MSEKSLQCNNQKEHNEYADIFKENSLSAKHQAEIDEYVKRVDLYHREPKCEFDLQKLSKYISENHLTNDDITEEFLENFRI